MCYLPPILRETSSGDLMRFLDPLCSSMERFIEEDPRPLSVKELSAAERKKAVEIVLRTLQATPTIVAIKRKHPGGFAPRTLFVRDKEKELRISFVGRRTLGTGSCKRVKELDTLVFNKESMNVRIKEEAIAIRTLLLKEDPEAKVLVFDDFQSEMCNLSKREWNFYMKFGDCPQVQYSSHYYTLCSATKRREKKYMVHPRAKAGCLDAFLSKVHTDELPAHALRLFSIFANCCRAFQAFHAKGYYYVDFKIENILGITPDEWVLGDLESLFSREEYMDFKKGMPVTHYIAPPEFLSLAQDKMDPEKHEAWSLGMSLLMAFGREDPFTELGIYFTTPKITKTGVLGLKQADLDRVICELTDRYPPSQGLPLRDLLLRLLRIDPSERISIEDAGGRLDALASIHS